MNNYQNCGKVRAKIDAVLHENAKIMQNLGASSTAKERELAKSKEKDNLRAVRALDPEFIDRLIQSAD